MANIIKKAVFSLMDKAFTQEGFVLEIKKWEPATLYEVVFHLPGTDMTKWNTIPRLKCKVSDFEYRDYTPATWNAEDRTCSVFIETGHKGYGSSWTKNLRIGDSFLFAAAHAASLPVASGKIHCFGDGSALGHFLALKQLTDRKEYPLEGIIVLSEAYILPEDFIAANPEFVFLIESNANSLDVLSELADDKKLAEYTSIYIAGYIPMVQGLRKRFKKISYIGAKLFAHGFWS